MDAALAVTAIVVAVALATLAAFVLARLIRTIAQLRRITLGLNDVMRWAIGRMPSEPPAPAPGVDVPAGEVRRLGAG